MTKQLTVVARIIAKQGETDLVKSELTKLIQPTRAEKGCINYDLHQDLKDPNLFLFYENWESHSLWQDHMKTSHIAAYQQATEGAIEDFTVDEMEVVTG